MERAKKISQLIDVRNPHAAASKHRSKRFSGRGARRQKDSRNSWQRDID